MPDDRFDDLGAPDKRTAAERLEELDRVSPEPDDPRRRPEVPRPGNRYAWVVGILMLMAIGVFAVTSSLPNKGEGLRGPAIGSQLPDFAAPSATGNADDKDDANVRQRTGGNDTAGLVPACEVISEEVVNVCELRRRPLLLTFLVTKGADCEPQVDRVERVRSEFPQVAFAAIVSGNEREDVARIAANRGWKIPVGVDHDGAVGSLYGVGVCPTTVLTTPGGRVRKVEIGNLTEDQLRTYVQALVKRSAAG